MPSLAAKEIYYEVLFALSGVKSSCIFENQLSIKEIISKSDLALLERIAAIGEKYWEITNFMETKCKDDSSGFYILKCVEMMEKCLAPYRATLVKLSSEHPCLSNVYSHIYPYSEIVTGLLTIVEELQKTEIRGCAILDTLDKHYNSSTRAVQIAIKYVHEGVSKLMLYHLQSWLLYGELSDTSKEFFIQKNSVNSSNPFDSVFLHYPLLPSFIRPTVAESILSNGQTVLFLRSRPYQKNVITSEIVPEVSIDSSGVKHDKGKDILALFQEADKSLPMQQWMLVERITQKVASLATTQLHYLAMVDGGLVKQVHNIKQIFLMGRGELFHEFVTQTDITFKGTSSFLDLNVILRACARKVLLQEDILDPFSLEMVPSEEGAQLTVRYSVPWPLQLLFTLQVIDTYNLVFRFLLRLKRIQVRMVTAWLSDKRKRRLISCAKRRQLQQNLWFLVNNLQYYLQVDVLESQFVTLEEAVISSVNFEQIQMAHSRFLANLVLQSFLSNPQDTKSTPNPVQQRLNNILTLCEEFCAQTEHDEEEEMPSDIVECLTVKFDGCFEKLLSLLEALKKHGGYLGCHHLSQLLLRLDFNRFFSLKSCQFN